MIWYILFALHSLLAICFSIHIVTVRRSPSAAAAWLLEVWLFPIAGALFYLVAGWHAEQPLRRGKKREHFVETIISGGCGSTIDRCNRVELLNDGGEMFPALIAELHRARRSINLEYYIFDDDRIGSTIADILMRKARGGVEVRLLYDALGSFLPAHGMLRELRRAGVEVRAFSPLRFPWFMPSTNERNHRKIAVIDGRVAFIGGINIARRYLEGNELGRWRDEHLRIEGGAVADLQGVFAADWIGAKGGRFDVEKSLAPYDPSLDMKVQIGWSQSGVTRRTLLDAFTAAIMRARHHVRISTPYFVPPESLLQAICIAAAAGVKVSLMTPARADLRVTAFAAESYFADLLAAGVEIYLYDGGFLHSKMLIIDDEIVSVGTANLDYRSLLTNWEVAAFVYDKEFAQMVARTYDNDIAKCHLLTAEEYNARPLKRRVAEGISRILAPLL